MSLCQMIVGLVVVQVDGDVQALRLQAEQAGAEVPGEGDGVLLEVVADAEVAQHLEEGEVLVVAYLVDVGGAEGLLAAGETATGRGLLAHEEGLEGHHAGGGEEQGGIAGGNQRSGRHVQMLPLLEKSDERTTYAVAVHGGYDSRA